MTSEILTPGHVRELRESGGPLPLAVGVVEYARRIVLLADSHEALRADRDRLAAEVERLRVAARDFLDHHSLDCGAHYCRYCPARSPEWKHETYCAYVRAQAAYTALSAVLAEAPKEGQ